MSSSSHSQARSVVKLGASRKRKEREASFEAFKKASASAATSSAKKADPSSATDNQLLAGYLAHEFLTKGTLLGQKWDPARAEAAPVSSARNIKAARGGGAVAGEKKAAAAGGDGGGGAVQAVVVVGQESYGEVANLLKSGGAHVPGIVNPTQLARWLQM